MYYITYIIHYNTIYIQYTYRPNVSLCVPYLRKYAANTLCPSVPQAEHEDKPKSSDDGASAAAVSGQNSPQIHTPPRRRHLPQSFLPAVSGSEPPLPPPALPPAADDLPTPDYRNHRAKLEKVKEEPPPTPQKLKKPKNEPIEEGPKLSQLVIF